MNLGNDAREQKTSYRRIALAVARLFVSGVFIVVAIALWRYLWNPNGITMNETISAFFGAMTSTGAAVGVLLKRGLMGALVRIGLAVAWCFLATLVITGIQGF